jgi:hypothetical protein
MKMTNDTYCVTFTGKRVTERYYRDRHGWLKADPPPEPRPSAQAPQ